MSALVFACVDGGVVCGPIAVVVAVTVAVVGLVKKVCGTANPETQEQEGGGE